MFSPNGFLLRVARILFLDASRKTGEGVTLAEARAESRDLLSKLLKGEKAGLLPNDFLPILSSHHLEYATFFSDAESQGALAWDYAAAAARFLPYFLMLSLCFLCSVF